MTSIGEHFGAFPCSHGLQLHTYSVLDLPATNLDLTKAGDAGACEKRLPRSPKASVTLISNDMYEFMDYIQNAFHDASVWNRDNFYSTLTETAHGGLPLVTPIKYHSILMTRLQGCSISVHHAERIFTSLLWLLQT